MHDPREGITADGMIRTGVDRRRIPATHALVVELLADAVAAVPTGAPGMSIYLYGSVATGTARAPSSDVDVLTLGMSPASAAGLGATLSGQFADLCRGVEISAIQLEDCLGHGDEAYGNRLFLRHYCLRLAGPDVAASWGPFPADLRAARGLNGDVARHQGRWRTQLTALEGQDAVEGQAALLGRRVARKTLLAVAGLVSVHDRMWTTDRERAARRWAQLRPARADDLQQLVDWAASRTRAGVEDLRRVVNGEGLVPDVVTSFRLDIGLWNDERQ